MNDSIKRHEEHPDGGMREDELGAYVMFDDVAVLIGENERMKAIIGRVVDNEKRVTVAYAHCCSGSVKYCDCVNKNHGTALLYANEAGEDYPIVSPAKGLFMTKDSELLQQDHFAVIVTTTTRVHHEGDERSRTHPGHGYPAYTEEIKSVDYIPFASAEDVANWVTSRGARDTRPYRIIKAQPMRVETSITVALIK